MTEEAFHSVTSGMLILIIICVYNRNDMTLARFETGQPE